MKRQTFENHGVFTAQRMLQLRARPRAAWGLLVLAVILSGCNARPAASAEEVYGYLRNAAYGANVARLDDSAQEYVDGVMKAFNAWKKAAEPVRTLCDSESLSGVDSDDWRTGKATAEVFPALAWITDPARTPDKPATTEKPDPKAAQEKPDEKHGAPTTTQLWRQLDEAIHRLPSGLSELRTERVRDVLGMEDRRRECDALAAACHRLVKLVTQHADRFKPAAKGLAFDDPAVTAEVQKEWRNLHDFLVAREDKHRTYLRSLVDEGTKTRSTMLAEKKGITSVSPLSDVQRQRLREIKIETDYYDAAIGKAQNELRAIEAKANEKARKDADSQSDVKAQPTSDSTAH